VPLHPIRFLQRGFNQADDLARQIRHPVWRMLRRARHGPSQASLPATARRNLESHYASSVRLVVARRLRGCGILQGATLVLIDDVMTTGATLDACAQVLMSEGAKEVRALTAARAVVAPPPPRLEPLPRDPSARR
jgi:predicted amidophosphoribosyltransferase